MWRLFLGFLTLVPLHPQAKRRLLATRSVGTRAAANVLDSFWWDGPKEIYTNYVTVGR